ncbi:MAG: NHL repeat-containing protein [Deltaproteobacteria bacterium]|nr:NHL repeat-containing protein [Deltaproteobacteria bacterium]MCL5792514.1 NHL repeat-containing protein [Deltaproteobacteria bacterium]
MFKNIGICIIALLLTYATIGASNANASVPVINGINAIPSALFPGRTSIIDVNASSTDNGMLVYTYSCNAGSFITWIGSQARWLSPVVGGHYTITITVSSTKGGEAFTYVSLEVQPAFYYKSLNNLEEPVYLTTDRNGNLYISEPYARRLTAFNSRDKILFSGSTTIKNGPLTVMNNMIYVASKTDGSINAYSTVDGGFVSTICKKNTFNNPSGIAGNDSARILYVSDGSNIHIIDTVCNRLGDIAYISNGMPVGMNFDNVDGVLSIADPLSANVTIINTLNNSSVQVGQYGVNGSIGWSGFNPGFDNGTSLIRPLSVAKDAFNRYYVADGYQNSVFVYTDQNMFVGSIGYYGTDPGAFKNPTSLAIDRTNGFLYVADPFNNRVEVFNIDKKPLPPTSSTTIVNPPTTIVNPPTTVTSNAVAISKSTGCACNLSGSGSGSVSIMDGMDGYTELVMLGLFMLLIRRKHA